MRISDAKGARLQVLFDRVVQDERLFAIGLCSLDGKMIRSSASFPRTLDCQEAQAVADLRDPRLRLAGGPVHVGVHTVDSETGPIAKLVLLHDMSFIDRRSQDTRRYLLLFIGALGLVIALITVIVAQLSWRGWVSGVRGLLRGEGLLRPMTATPEMAPLAAEIRARMRDLEDEYRRAQGPQASWDAERLRALLRTQLQGDQVIVVSNREPYIHESGPDGIVVRRPASGLVTAVEPVMRACSGTWIAHGSGSADRTVVDRHDRVRRAARAQRIRPAAHLAQPRGGEGLLLRLRQRRHVAAVPCRPCAPGVPGIRLGALPDRQPALRRCRRRRGPRRGSGRPGAGLPLRAVAGDDSRPPAPGDHPDFLAHPLAEPRILRHLSLAAGDSRGHARQHDPRLSHPLPLQELHRDRRSLPRGAHRA